MAKIVGVSEYRDSHTVVTFTIPPGLSGAGTQWARTERVPYASLIVHEMRATVTGGAGDVDLVIESATVRLEDDSGRMLFERPIGILAVTEQNRDVDTEERLTRLERMMNVLVEQDSVAGEALRRLGGSKITFESPTRLAMPAIFNEHRQLGVRMNLHTPITLLNDVAVRVSLIGISKNSVA